jgi:hypothetical protein
MAVSISSPARQQAGGPCLLLGQNARGLWVVRKSAGRKGGLFLSRDAALRFARLESTLAHFALVDVADVLEFDYAG